MIITYTCGAQRNGEIVLLRRIYRIYAPVHQVRAACPEVSLPKRHGVRKALGIGQEGGFEGVRGRGGRETPKRNNKVLKAKRLMPMII